MFCFRCITTAFLIFFASASAELPPGFVSAPFEDSIQTVPGKLWVYRYDVGAKGVTWNDVSGGNSGDYPDRNPTDIDMSKVKSLDCVIPDGGAEIVIGEPYWGWVEPEDWVKMTVEVKTTGRYRVNTQTTNQSENPYIEIAFLDGTDSITTGELEVPQSAVNCGGWFYHSWKKDVGVDTLSLTAGMQVFKLRCVGWGPMNVQWVELEFIDGTPVQPAGLPSGMRIDGLRAAEGGLLAGFTLAEPGPVSLSLFGLRGELLGSTEFSDAAAGSNIRLWKGEFKPGIRFLRMNAGSRSVERAVVVGE